MNYNSLKTTSSRKRKDGESFYGATSSERIGTNPATTSFNGAEPQPLPSNRLLAGYMAYEFLTRRTLFGESFDPARSESITVESTEPSEINEPSRSRAASEPPTGKLKSRTSSYAEVVSLLKNDGVHIPGVVNPTQLARWI